MTHLVSDSDSDDVGDDAVDYEDVTRNVEEDKEDTAVKLDLADIEVVLSWMFVLRLLEGRRTVEIFGLSTDRVGVVRRGGFGGVTNLRWRYFTFCNFSRFLWKSKCFRGVTSLQFAKPYKTPF